MPRLRIPFRLSWRSFNLQLILVAILPLTILLVALVFGSLMLHHEAMRSLVAERDLRAVRAAANSLNQELYHRAETIRMLASDLGESHNLEALSSRIFPPTTGF